MTSQEKKQKTIRRTKRRTKGQTRRIRRMRRKRGGQPQQLQPQQLQPQQLQPQQLQPQQLQPQQLQPQQLQQLQPQINVDGLSRQAGQLVSDSVRNIVQPSVRDIIGTITNAGAEIINNYYDANVKNLGIAINAADKVVNNAKRIQQDADTKKEFVKNIIANTGDVVGNVMSDKLAQGTQMLVEGATSPYASQLSRNYPISSSISSNLARAAISSQMPSSYQQLQQQQQLPLTQYSLSHLPSQQQPISRHQLPPPSQQQLISRHQLPPPSQQQPISRHQLPPPREFTNIQRGGQQIINRAEESRKKFLKN